MPTTGNDPGVEYAHRLAARRAGLQRQEQRSQVFWRLRRAVFTVGVVMMVAAFAGFLPAYLLLLPVAVFIALMAAHQRVHEATDVASRAVAFYQRGIARLSDDWIGGGEAGDRFADRTHPYSEDLDLFGRGSLFELLSIARTRAGEDKLAAWLLAPATPDEIRSRQSAVAELRPLLDLREDLALLGAGLRADVHPQTLYSWGAAPPIHFSRAMRIVAAVLGATTLAAVLSWLVLGWRSVALVALLCEAIFHFSTRYRVGQVISDVERPSRDLRLLAAILERLERETFNAPRLAALRAALDTEGLPASRQIARLYVLIDVLNSTKNIVFAPIAFLLLLPAQLAFAIERWRQVSGVAVARWLDAIGEFEAFASFAGYSAEHPDDPFPELVTEGACFEGEGLAHPLIPEAKAVRNDVALENERQVLIVSGSNMSGKSTLLRTVGVNAVLALAGAPVRAQRLRVTPLAVGASIHILDSLQAGSSRFYAEITRLRGLVELTNGDLPLLFLLDEILSGTNSHDRRIGAAAVVRGLVERGAIGFITTHDLALTHIADELGPRAMNVHFEDQLENGQMIFDYKMRPGVVSKSNALELMRAVGLDVP